MQISTTKEKEDYRPTLREGFSIGQQCIWQELFPSHQPQGTPCPCPGPCLGLLEGLSLFHISPSGHFLGLVLLEACCQRCDIFVRLLIFKQHPCWLTCFWLNKNHVRILIKSLQCNVIKAVEVIAAVTDQKHPSTNHRRLFWDLNIQRSVFRLSCLLTWVQWKKFISLCLFHLNFWLADVQGVNEARNIMNGSPPITEFYISENVNFPTFSQYKNFGPQHVS